MSLIRVRDLAGGKVKFYTVASDDVHVRDGGSHGRHRGYDGRIRLPTQEILEHTTILE